MEWKKTPGLTHYPEALALMAARVAAIQRGEAEELVWLVEHPPVYTLGTSAKASDVLAEASGHHNPSIVSPVSALPTYETGRGGQVTYHGPGQRVVYLMLNLKKRAAEQGAEPDLRAYVKQLEAWIIAMLATFGVAGFTRAGRVGVWVSEDSAFGIQDSAKKKGDEATLTIKNGSTFDLSSSLNPESRMLSAEKKIAALGVRVQKWVTSHGIAINVNPDLSHYAGIVPCGIREFGVTSLAAMGVNATMDEVDAALLSQWKKIF